MAEDATTKSNFHLHYTELFMHIYSYYIA